MVLTKKGLPKQHGRTGAGKSPGADNIRHEKDAAHKNNADILQQQNKNIYEIITLLILIPLFPCGIHPPFCIPLPFYTVNSEQLSVNNCTLSIIHCQLSIKKYHFRGGRMHTMSCLSSMLSYLSPYPLPVLREECRAEPPRFYTPPPNLPRKGRSRPPLFWRGLGRGAQSEPFRNYYISSSLVRRKHLLLFPLIPFSPGSCFCSY